MSSLSFYLNSEDVHEMDLPMTHSRAKGGTMVIWHSSLSSHIRVLPTSSPSFVSVLHSPSPLPNILPPVHTGVYLPTAGRDGEWLNGLVELELYIMETREKYRNNYITAPRVPNLRFSAKWKRRACLNIAVL